MISIKRQHSTECGACNNIFKHFYFYLNFKDDSFIYACFYDKLRWCVSKISFGYILIFPRFFIVCKCSNGLFIFLFTPYSWLYDIRQCFSILLLKQKFINKQEEYIHKKRWGFVAIKSPKVHMLAANSDTVYAATFWQCIFLKQKNRLMKYKLSKNDTRFTLLKNDKSKFRLCYAK